MMIMSNKELLTILCVLTFLNSCLCGRRRGTIIQMSHKDRGMNVNYFNDLRRDVRAADMREMIWDPVLAGRARRWAKKCIFNPSKDETYGQLLYKEFFNPITRPGEVIMNSIRSWAMQQQNYTHGSWYRCEKEGTCQYIQMISSSSESVGCALTRCPILQTEGRSRQKDMYYAVCFISPKSTPGTSPYIRGRRCSQCPSGLSCRKKLCSRRSKRRRRPAKKRRLPSGDGTVLKRQYLNDKSDSLNKSKSTELSDVQPSLPQASIKITSSEIKEASLLHGRYLDNRGQVRIPKNIDSVERYNLYGTSSSAEKQRVLSRRFQKKGVAGRTIPEAPSGQANRVKRQVRDPYAAERERRRQERLRYDRQRQLRAQELRAQQERRERERRQRQRRQEYERELERRRQEYNRRNRRPSAPQQQQALAGGMEQTDKYYLEQVHNTLRGTSMREMNWDNYLEKWAKYVIRCDIEYPGPIDCYTNFGKVNRDSNVYNVVYDWGSEGNNITRRLQYGCRTPSDIERCNHNIIVRNASLRKFGCAAMSCGAMKQVTCIYK